MELILVDSKLVKIVCIWNAEAWNSLENISVLYCRKIKKGNKRKSVHAFFKLSKSFSRIHLMASYCTHKFKIP